MLIDLPRKKLNAKGNIRATPPVAGSKGKTRKRIFTDTINA